MNSKSVKKAYGTHRIAAICQVTPPTIWQWLKEGRLPSFTTGGGHHRVWAEDLVTFLRAHNMPIPSELDNTRPLRILIVNDDPSVRKTMRRTVQESFPDAEIHEASDGEEASRKVPLLSPAVVIVDMHKVDEIRKITPDKGLKRAA